MKFGILSLVLILFCAGPVSAFESRKECEQLLTRWLDPAASEKDPFFDYSEQDFRPGELLKPHEDAEVRALQHADELARVSRFDLPLEGRPTLAQLSLVFKAISENEVARLDRLDEIDPMRKIGFCFGRAIAAHVEAMFQGISEAFIRKAFVVGPSSHTTETLTESWRYHVTTTILAADGIWYALDPRLPEPTPLAEWLEHFAQYGNNGVAFYVTHPRRFSIEEKSYYSPRVLRIRTRHWQEIEEKIAAYLRALFKTYGIETP